MLKQSQFVEHAVAKSYHNNFMVPCEKFKIVSSAF